MSREISNTEDILDSRDIIARIDELKSELETAHQEAIESDEDAPEDFGAWLEVEETEEADEYRALSALAEEGEGSPDWQYGETLIRESYFTEYAEELANDIGAINRGKDDSWPLNHIDWEAAADELKQDYATVDYDGVTYFIRA